MLHLLHRLTFLDWLMLAVLAFSAIRAFLRGMVRELFWLGGSILGLALACAYYPLPAKLLQHIVTSPPLADLISFLLILFGVMILAGLLGRAMRSAVRFAGLGLLDSLAGGLFGLMRGLLLVTAGMMAVAAFLPGSNRSEKNISSSVLAPYFLSAAHAVSSVVPTELESRIRSGLLLLKQQWQHPQK
jgi:membrane protein required for colicin V production